MMSYERYRNFVGEGNAMSRSAYEAEMLAESLAHEAPATNDPCERLCGNLSHEGSECFTEVPATNDPPKLNLDSPISYSGTTPDYMVQFPAEVPASPQATSDEGKLRRQGKNWGTGSVIHGASGSLGQASRDSAVFDDRSKNAQRLREGSPRDKAPADEEILRETLRIVAAEHGIGIDADDIYFDPVERNPKFLAHEMWTMGATLKHKKCRYGGEDAHDGDCSNECGPCESYLLAIADLVLTKAARATELQKAQAEVGEQWWITDGGFFAQGGRKWLGPFLTRDDALTMRSRVEKADPSGMTYCVDSTVGAS